MALCKHVTIIGLGLIGGSLGLAAKRRRLAATVMGCSRKASTVRRARARGAIDVGTTDTRRAVADADLVVLATPVGTIVPLGARVARFMRPGSLLTDVGSTKARVVRDLERSLPRHVKFVGGHPIAGSEQRGIGAASAALFDGSSCILTRTARTDSAALATVSRLWRSLGCRVVVMSPEDHDRLLATASHLPHVLAYSLALALSDSSIRLPRLPRSFLDATRIAKSDPDLWDDIFLSNRRHVLEAIDRFERTLRQFRACVAQPRPAALRRLLRRAKARRDHISD